MVLHAESFVICQHIMVLFRTFLRVNLKHISGCLLNMKLNECYSHLPNVGSFILGFMHSIKSQVHGREFVLADGSCRL